MRTLVRRDVRRTRSMTSGATRSAAQALVDLLGALSAPIGDLHGVPGTNSTRQHLVRRPQTSTPAPDPQYGAPQASTAAGVPPLTTGSTDDGLASSTPVLPAVDIRMATATADRTCPASCGCAAECVAGSADVLAATGGLMARVPTAPNQHPLPHPHGARLRRHPLPT